MFRFFATGCAIVVCLLAAGCSQAPPPAPPDTRAADEKAIRDDDIAWNADWAAKDAEKIVGHYADDAILMVPDMPSMKGKEAIRAGLKMVLADPNVALTFSYRRIRRPQSSCLSTPRSRPDGPRRDPPTSFAESRRPSSSTEVWCPRWRRSRVEDQFPPPSCQPCSKQNVCRPQRSGRPISL